MAEAKRDNTRTPIYNDNTIERIDPYNAWDGTEIAPPSGKMKVSPTLEDYVSLNYGDVGEPIGGSPMDYMDAPAKAAIPLMSEKAVKQFLESMSKNYAGKRAKAIGNNWGRTVYGNTANEDRFTKQLLDSWDNMPEEARDFQIRNMLANNFGGGSHFGKNAWDEPILVSHFNPETMSINFEKADIPAGYVDKAVTVNHELGHLGDYNIAPMFRPANPYDNYRSMQIGLHNYIPTMRGSSGDAIMNNWRDWSSRLYDKYGLEYNNAINELGDLMIDNAYIKPARRVRNDINKAGGHPIEYRERSAQSHSQSTNPMAAASDTEGLANTTGLMGVHKGSDLLMHENPTLFDRYMGYVKEDPRNSEDWSRIMVPEEFLW